LPRATRFFFFEVPSLGVFLGRALDEAAPDGFDAARSFDAGDPSVNAPAARAARSRALVDRVGVAEPFDVDALDAFLAARRSRFVAPSSSPRRRRCGRRRGGRSSGSTGIFLAKKIEASSL
jgi:hypothetical protein